MLKTKHQQHVLDISKNINGIFNNFFVDQMKIIAIKIFYNMDQVDRIHYIVISLRVLGESCTPKNEMIYHFVSQCLDSLLDD